MDAQLLPEMLENGFSPTVMNNIKDDGFDMDCLRAVQGLPSSYLQYYYCRAAKLEYLKSGKKSRAEVCMEIEEQLLEMNAIVPILANASCLSRRSCMNSRIPGVWILANSPSKVPSSYALLSCRCHLVK